MVLNNMKALDEITTPSLLRKKIVIGTNCRLSSSEIKLFQIAIDAVAEQIKCEMINDDYDEKNLNSVTVCFSLNGDVSYSIEKDIHELGVHFFTIIYIMNRLRQVPDQRFLFATYIEELAHHFWRIENEKEIKYKVVEIAKRFDKEFSIDLFKRWGILM